MTKGRVAAVLLSMLVLSAQAAPAVGRYEAQLCVATSSVAAPTCGPARLEWRKGQRARIQVADIVYSLTLHSSQLDVVLSQGAMQLDEFTADYRWTGKQTLQFADTEKGARYEVQIGAPAGK